MKNYLERTYGQKTSFKIPCSRYASFIMLI